MDLRIIKGLMAQNGDKQRDLANILGISIYSLRNKINGRVPLTVFEFEKIVKHYKCSADIFFCESASKNETT